MGCRWAAGSEEEPEEGAGAAGRQGGMLQVFRSSSGWSKPFVQQGYHPVRVSRSVLVFLRVCILLISFDDSSCETTPVTDIPRDQSACHAY